MSSRASDNLKCYLGQAILPQMTLGMSAPKIPPPGHKSHRNKLTVRFEEYRKLQNTFLIMEANFLSMVLDWIDDYIPSESFAVEDEDVDTGERFSIDAPLFCKIPYLPLMRPTEISRVLMWIDQLPLGTVQRAVHLAYPETRNWGFFPSGEVDVDEDIFKHVEWKNCKQAKSTKLIVVVQPPWVLSEQDLQSFRNCQSFPQKREDLSPTELESKYRLWGKIWDLCVRKDCRWFAVSTYNGWIFGAFSEGWTLGFTSPVMEWNLEVPSVVEALTFWLMSSMGGPGTWKMPQVLDTVENLTTIVSVPQPNTLRATRNYSEAQSDKDGFSYTRSESSWTGKSKGPPSSAGFVLSTTLTAGGLSPRPARSPVPESRWQPKSIQLWAETTPQDDPIQLSGNPPSPTGTSSTDWSQLTATPTNPGSIFQPAQYGNWITLPFNQRAASFQLVQ